MRGAPRLSIAPNALRDVFWPLWGVKINSVLPCLLRRSHRRVRKLRKHRPIAPLFSMGDSYRDAELDALIADLEHARPELPPESFNESDGHLRRRVRQEDRDLVATLGVCPANPLDHRGKKSLKVRQQGLKDLKASMSRYIQ